MTLYTAEQLDLSRLPPFDLVTVDAEAERLALVAGIQARFDSYGVPYTVAALRTDPAMILAEEFAYRKTLTMSALNDAGKRLTLLYGYGEALDHVAATMYADLGLRRLALVENPRPYVYGSEAAADWESDARFKLRIALAPQARTPGTLGGYEYAALTAAPHLIDAVAYNYASGLTKPGGIVVVVLGRDPDPNPQTAKPAEEEPAQLVLAQDALYDRDTKLGSDVVAVRAARRVTAIRVFRLGIRQGPDPNLALSQAARAYAAYLAGRRRVGKAIYLSGETAALTVGGVEYVRPEAGSGLDVDPGPDGVVQVVGPGITPEVIGG